METSIGSDAWCRREIIRLGAIAAIALSAHGVASDEDTLTVKDPPEALWEFAQALLEVKDIAETLLMWLGAVE